MICALCGKQTPNQSTQQCPSCGRSPFLQGAYRLDEIVGRGASGVTYRATRLSDGAVVAIKELSFRSLDSFKSLELFEREVKVLKQLKHPGIPAYFQDFYIEEGKHCSFYLVQEFIAGKTLAQEAEGKRYTQQEVLRIACEVLGILAYLHQLSPSVIHRDLKPQNIMRRDSNGRLVLLDFGSVKDSLKESLQGGSTVAGTFGYMAPEQFQGKALPASDIYSLGAILVSLLSGVSAEKLLNSQNQLAWHTRIQVRPEVRALFDRMLALNAAHRPQDAATLQREIERLLADWDARPASPKPQPTVQAPSGRGWALSLGLTLSLLVGGVVFAVLVSTSDPVGSISGALSGAPQPKISFGEKLGWFDQYARPLAVDVNNDGVEDLIALYIKGDLRGYVGAFDGRSYQELWSVGPFGERKIAAGKLLAALAGKRLMIADFEGNASLYELSTGTKVASFPQDEVARDLCGAPPGKSEVWLEPPGILINGDTAKLSPGNKPKRCNDSYDGGDGSEDLYDSYANRWHFHSDEKFPKLPRFDVLKLFKEGGDSFALAQEKTGYQRYFLLQYDPKTLEISWQKPLQEWIGDQGELLLEESAGEISKGIFALGDGAFVFMYKEKTSRSFEEINHIVSVEIKTSQKRYDTVVHFSSFRSDQSLITQDRLYLLDLEWDFPRLHIIDRRAGTYLARFGKP